MIKINPILLSGLFLPAGTHGLGAELAKARAKGIAAVMYHKISTDPVNKSA